MLYGCVLTSIQCVSCQLKLCAHSAACARHVACQTLCRQAFKDERAATGAVTKHNCTSSIPYSPHSLCATTKLLAVALAFWVKDITADSQTLLTHSPALRKGLHQPNRHILLGAVHSPKSHLELPTCCFGACRGAAAGASSKEPPAGISLKALSFGRGGVKAPLTPRREMVPCTDAEQ